MQCYRELKDHQFPFATMIKWHEESKRNKEFLVINMFHQHFMSSMKISFSPFLVHLGVPGMLLIHPFLELDRTVSAGRYTLSHEKLWDEKEGLPELVSKVYSLLEITGMIDKAIT